MDALVVRGVGFMHWGKEKKRRNFLFFFPSQDSSSENFYVHSCMYVSANMSISIHAEQLWCSVCVHRYSCCLVLLQTGSFSLLDLRPLPPILMQPLALLLCGKFCVCCVLCWYLYMTCINDMNVCMYTVFPPLRVTVRNQIKTTRSFGTLSSVRSLHE